MDMMSLFLRQARPPRDDEVIGLLSSLTMARLLEFINNSPDFTGFYDRFLNWAGASSRVHFGTSSDFTPAFSAGVTEAFNNFYIENADRKLFLLKGEYPYHRDVYDSLGRKYDWYQPDLVNSGSMLIVSSPFSGNGNFQDEIYDVLRNCEARGVAVMLDFAFAGLGARLDIQELISFSCVRQFGFSFSKMFSLGKFRAGLCWMREPKGPLGVLRTWNYINWPAAYFALRLMENFSFDYMADKYRPIQERICLAKGLRPSQSYLFGIGGEEYASFARDGLYNRVCISPAMSQGE